jgi:signal transduction histidine kinase
MRKILYVENDAIDRMAFERHARISSFPYEYTIAASRAEAEELLLDHSYDALLLDYHLGDGTAFDLLGHSVRCPVILITGAGDEETAIRAMKAGASDYLVKDPEYSYLKTLGITIENALHRRETEAELLRYREHLEDLVAQRTADLHREMEERQLLEKEKELLQGLIIQAAEKERQRIGQDLHDGLGQSLSGVRFLINLLKEESTTWGDRGVTRKISEIDDIIKDSIRQTRDLSKTLCPVDLHQGGLQGALEEMAQTVTRIFNVTCVLHYDPSCSCDREESALNLYYIAREAVNNALRHGGAMNITIQVINDPPGLTMIIQDDGRGAPLAAPPDAGIGLRIMNYRAAMIGGVLRAENVAGGGFRVVVAHARGEQEKP